MCSISSSVLLGSDVLEAVVMSAEQTLASSVSAATHVSGCGTSIASQTDGWVASETANDRLRINSNTQCSYLWESTTCNFKLLKAITD